MENKIIECYFGDINFRAKVNSVLKVTWDKDRLGEKKDFISKLKVIDQTHYYGIAPYYMGMKRCKDLWHSYYIPCKDSIIRVENSDGEIFEK